jgi:hypothetical protein
VTIGEDGALEGASGTTERDPMIGFDKSMGLNLEFFPTTDLSPSCSAFTDPSQPGILWDATSFTPYDFKLLEE